MAKEDGRRAVAVGRQTVRTPRPHFRFLLLLLLTPLIIVVVVLHSGYATVRGSGGWGWTGPAMGGAPAEEEGRAMEVTVAVTSAGRQAVSIETNNT